MEAGAPEPLKVGVVSLVLLSTLEEPESLAASTSGAEVGAVGIAVSRMTGERAGESPDSLPAASKARAVIEYVPSVRAALVQDQLPTPSDVVVHRIVPDT